jgi:hypothetical protein
MNVSVDDFKHLIESLNNDEAVMVTLKGHLVIEEKITGAIKKIVFHPSILATPD